MTSNIGANEIRQNKQLGFGGEDAQKINERDVYMEALKKKFKPELINRIDVICIFESLSKAHLVEIAKILLSSINKRFASRGLGLEVTQEAIEYLVAKGSNLIYGARPLKRFIEQEIEDKIAEKILLGTLQDTGKILVGVEDGKLVFKS